MNSQTIIKDYLASHLRIEQRIIKFNLKRSKWWKLNSKTIRYTDVKNSKNDNSFVVLPTKQTGSR